MDIVVTLGFGQPIVQPVGALTFYDWDMSTNKFPSNSLRGNPYYGINGPSTSLKDRNGDSIPNGVILWPLVDNASTTNATQWAIQYTIMP